MKTCPRCGAEASGKFCSDCGAALEARPCPACGATPEPGARFCNQCGAPQGRLGAAATGGGTPGAGGAALGGAAGMGPAAASGRGSRIPAGAAPGARRGGGASDGPPSKMGWWVAGVFFVGLVLILALPVLRRDTVPESSTPFAAPAGGGAPPDISNMTPRQAADRLYDRVMRADASGNVAEVQQFLPMAIDAHEMARPLDLDGLFHLALLHQTRGDHVSALAVSGEMLGQNPDYLLGLSVAAESSAAMEDAETARGHYERFLEAYDRELSRGLEEYEIHSVTLTTTRQSAIAATAP